MQISAAVVAGRAGGSGMARRRPVGAMSAPPWSRASRQLREDSRVNGYEFSEIARQISATRAGGSTAVLPREWLAATSAAEEDSCAPTV